jgi:hypothetical protein
MDSDLSAVRSHPAVIVSVVIAAITLTACALVAIAYMLGWVPLKDASTPGGMAAPGQQVTGTAPGVALLPGETLIDNPESPKAATPVSPPPAAIAAPTPAPPPIRPAPAVRPQPAPPSYAKSPPLRAAPSAPTYLREEPPPRSYERSIRGVCVNCGTVASIGASGGDWEVRVRFEDGSSQLIRYPERPPLRVGERVHLEDGRLLPD